MVAPIPFKERTLKNGLRVLSAIDRATPNVTVQVWYGVGAKDDPKGRSGFAHLFEHMMFKATRDMPAEHMDRLTEDVGGENNASTAEDFTDYYGLVPANHLQTLLWAEAERMTSLHVDEANFQSERAVVEEELRQRVLADPYGRFFRLAIPINSFTVHPYKRPAIGSIADLDASTLSDVKAFHDTYYRPDDATLVVVGNFDQAQLDHWVDQYFGDIKNPDAAFPRVTITEPARTGTKSVNAYGPVVPLPAVAMTWLIPAAKDPDFAALRVLDAVLTTGKSSRLYAHMIYKTQVAQSVFSNADDNQQPGLFYVGAVMSEGHTPAQGEAAILADLARLRTGPVGAEELTRAKNQILAQELSERETILGRGVELGESTVVEGDPTAANTAMDKVMAVTPADLQRVVKTYLSADRRVTIAYRAESERPKGEAVSNDDAALDAIGTPLASTAVAPPPPAALPTVEPTPTAPPVTAPPVLAERTLEERPARHRGAHHRRPHRHGGADREVRRGGRHAPRRNRHDGQPAHRRRGGPIRQPDRRRGGSGGGLVGVRRQLRLHPRRPDGAVQGVRAHFADHGGRGGAPDAGDGGAGTQTHPEARRLAGDAETAGRGGELHRAGRRVRNRASMAARWAARPHR